MKIQNPGIIKRVEMATLLTAVYKAFYTGAGYSGVHDPDYEIPPQAAEFHREGYEQLKRHRKLVVQGNAVRAEVQESTGGMPVIRLYDAITFNSQPELQSWLQRAKAKQVNKRRYILPADILEDRTWPSR